MSRADAITIRSGPWDAGAIDSFLQQARIPLRIASSGSTGPLVQSLWFIHEDGALWCCTRNDALLAQRLRLNPRCGFEVSGDQPPYRGVRGQGTAQILKEPAAALLPRLIERYLGSRDSDLARWLLSRIDDEVAIRIGDLAVSTFDYARRMGS